MRKIFNQYWFLNLVFLLGCAMVGYYIGKTSDRKELHLLRNYFEKTELMIDTIYQQRNDYYLDVLTEQDVYAEYYDAMVNVNRHGRK